MTYCGLEWEEEGIPGWAITSASPWVLKQDFQQENLSDVALVLCRFSGQVGAHI